MSNKDLITWKNIYDLLNEMKKDQETNYRRLENRIDEVKKDQASDIRRVEEKIDEIQVTQANQQGKNTGITAGVSFAMGVFTFLTTYFTMRRV